MIPDLTIHAFRTKLRRRGFTMIGHYGWYEVYRLPNGRVVRARLGGKTRREQLAFLIRVAEQSLERKEAS